MPELFFGDVFFEEFEHNGVNAPPFFLWVYFFFVFGFFKYSFPLTFPLCVCAKVARKGKKKKRKKKKKTPSGAIFRRVLQPTDYPCLKRAARITN